MIARTSCMVSASRATPVWSGITKYRADFEALMKQKNMNPVSADVA